MRARSGNVCSFGGRQVDDDANLPATGIMASPMRRLAVTTLLAVGLAVLAASAAVAAWVMTRPESSPTAATAPATPQPGPEPPGHEPPATPAAPQAEAGPHHGTDDAGGRGTTAAQQAEADALVRATRDALSSAGYDDVAVAEADGYRAVQPPSSSLVHYVHFTRLIDAAVLDPAAPESLVYRSTPDGPVLEGAMYVLPSVDSPIPDLGGLSAHWHAHDDLCFSTSTLMVVGTVDGDRRCPPGAINQVTPPMLHVWATERPGGPFAGL